MIAQNFDTVAPLPNSELGLPLDRNQNLILGGNPDGSSSIPPSALSGELLLGLPTGQPNAQLNPTSHNPGLTTESLVYF